MKLLPFCAVGVLIVSTAAFAQSSNNHAGKPAASGTAAAQTEACNAKDNDCDTDTGSAASAAAGEDLVLRKRPGRTTYAPSSAPAPARDQGGNKGQSTERKKMEKLPYDEAEPLELMDETDPCPTLPC